MYQFVALKMFKKSVYSFMKKSHFQVIKTVPGYKCCHLSKLINREHVMSFLYKKRMLEQIVKVLQVDIPPQFEVAQTSRN